MATIIVEDGTIVASANSYISAANYATYAADRGYTLTGTAAVNLILAMDYLESQAFIGTKYSEAQTTQWPRTGAYIDGYLFDDDDIPQLLIDAQCEIAAAIDAGYNPSSTIPIQKRRVKVGEVEVEYASGSSTAIVRTYKIKLAKLVNNGGFFTVTKA